MQFKNRQHPGNPLDLKNTCSVYSLIREKALYRSSLWLPVFNSKKCRNSASSYVSLRSHLHNRYHKKRHPAKNQQKQTERSIVRLLLTVHCKCPLDCSWIIIEQKSYLVSIHRTNATKTIINQFRSSVRNGVNREGYLSPTFFLQPKPNPDSFDDKTRHASAQIKTVAFSLQFDGSKDALLCITE